MRTKAIIALVFTALLLSLAIVPAAMASDPEPGTTAALGESIVLAPTEAVNAVGTEHTVTATVRDDAGALIVGENVTFTITAGPNVGLSDWDITDEDGQAFFAYSSAVEGTDTIQACYVPSYIVQSQDEVRLICSNEVTKTWQKPVPPIPEISTMVLLGIGLLMLGGLVVLVRRKASAA